MAKITFVGNGFEDLRILNADDLKRHSGVEGFRKTEFRQGEEVEVSTEVAAALLEKPEIYGIFKASDDAEELDIQGETIATDENTTASNEGAARARTSGTRSGGTTGSGTTSGSTASSAKA